MCVASPQAHQTIQNPKIPYIGPIDGGLKIGMSLYFKGKVLPDAPRCSFNLQYGDAPGCAIPLHLNPRFGPGKVCMNSFDGGWKKEEVPESIPFCQGAGFELIIAVTKEGYEVRVNGQLFHLFKHRMAVEPTRFLTIGLGVTIEVVHIYGVGQGAARGNPGHGPGVKIPHWELIPGGLQMGMSIHIQGSLPGRLRRFAVNLRCGENRCSDIAMHFKPVFRRRRQVVVFKSFQSGRWRNKEKLREAPFKKGEGFDLVIAATSAGYQVTINGKQFHLFNHCIPLKRVTWLQIWGQAIVQTVNIIGGGQQAIVAKPGQRELVVQRIPFVGPIPGGLKAGMSMCFKGTVHRRIRGFHINLQCGENRCAGIAMHFSPRFRCHPMVIFNSFWHGWNRDERLKDNPFRKGEDFELVFNITEAGYQVSVNGKEFHLFAHRIPLKQVRALQIGGDISIQTVYLTGGGEVAEVSAGEPVTSNTPYARPIFGGLRAGMSVYIQGTVLQKPKGFAINFCCGEMKWCDKALHFNPQFTPMEVVVFKDFKRGKWRREFTVNEMPFSKGEDFEMVILLTSEGYQVKVNNHLLHTFGYRIPLERVSSLEVVGDVHVRTATVTEAGQEHPGVRELVIKKIPFKGPIVGGLSAGMSMYIQGTVHQQITRFHINLLCGETGFSDITFHFNPRFGSHPVVVCNSYQHGWNKEERPAEMPFRKGEDFELVFDVTKEGYQVSVNEKNFHLFKHRIPVERVKALAIGGDVSIHTVRIFGGENDRKPESPAGGKLLPIPCVRYVTGGLRTGISLYFKATVPKNSNSFIINLQSGDQKGCDIIFHFNHRFSGEGMMLNSFQNNSWGKEEQPKGTPFGKGDTFELVILVTSEGYQVLVNRQHFYLYRHRMPVHRVSTLFIGGEIDLHVVDIIGGGPVGLYEQPGKMVNTPYVRPIHVRLSSGMAVFVQGAVPQKAARFQIDFRCGETKLANIALHFNPRFSPCELVVFNSYLCGQRQREDRVREMPLRMGEDFELLFAITSTGYQVVVNDRVFHTFKHRIPVERVTALEVGGDVFIENVSIIEAGQENRHLGLGMIVVPKIPFVGAIPSGLRPGMSLVFQGTVLNQANRFAINLQYGELKCSDKAMHFNPRFGGRAVVVFNSNKCGWKKEERVYRMPFTKGESFEVVFKVTSVGYQVHVNGSKFYLFKHRMPHDQVRAVEIAGDVTIQRFIILGGEPQPTPEQPSIKEVLKIPYEKPMSLNPGMSVVVKGTVPSDSKTFSVNLHCVGKDPCDKALHINPRIDQNAVGFNAFLNGSWGKLEELTGNLFSKGKDFELVILATTEGYQLTVNGQQLYFFQHRMTLGKVRALNVQGDVALHSVNLTEGGPGGVQISPIIKEVVPNTPYEWPIPGGLRTGMSVYIRGIIPQKPNRFAVNFECGEMKGSDISFHLNPRFWPCQVMVLNTFRKGWGKEERPKRMPFFQGERFEMVIVITAEGYKVNVNGRVFYTYRHRMPVDRVSSLAIWGDVFVEKVEIIGGLPGLVQKLGLEEVVVNSIPYLGPIHGRLRPGMSLYFQGTLPRKMVRFFINLRCGELKCSDIALHFNPRFGHTQVVVLNHFSQGWKKEERPTEMPFTKGESFEMVIAVTTEGFQVIVNGRHFHLFRHRIPVERVRALEIGGSVSMQTVHIIRPSTPYYRPIPGGLRPGMSVILQGMVPLQANRFSVNLLCGDTYGCDNAFHFNPRFLHAELVVCNSYRKKGWEAEERVGRMPFTRGGTFEIVIYVTEKAYEVFVNGQPFHVFKHRIPVEQVKGLGIYQDVSIHNIDISEGIPMRPKPAPERKPDSESDSDSDSDSEDEEEEVKPGPLVVEELKIPYKRPLLFFGRVSSITFQGMVPNDSKSFSINLMCGVGKDSAFHFSPQFEASTVLINTFCDGKWGKEEKSSRMPFTKGQRFELLIVVKQQGFQVFVNGRKFCLFQHRLPVASVSRLEVTGGVSLYSVDVVGDEPEIAVCPGVPPSEPDIEEAEIVVCPPMMELEPVIGKIPFVRPITDSLKPGMSVYFQGTIPQRISSFYINFKVGDSKCTDIALSFRPRFRPYEAMAFNSFQKGSWQTEETVSDMLLIRGASFEMVFVITEVGFKVTINGCKVLLFKHRIAVGQVTALEVAGDVTMETVTVIKEMPVVPAEPGDVDEEEEEEDKEKVEEEKDVLPEYPPTGLGEVSIMKVPDVRPITNGLKPGMSLFIQGIAPHDVTRFSFGLRSGEAGGDKPFLCTVRMEATLVIVFNSFLKGAWGKEETVTKVPFRQGHKFLVVITVTTEGYQMLVNGVELHFFKFRAPVGEVTGLETEEDFSLRIEQEEPKEEPAKPDKEEIAPYVQPIPDGLKKGMSLYFQGTLPDDITWFTINLYCGDADIAFHFNPQLDSGVVFFKSFQGGKWEPEEKSSVMPFSKGKDFDLLYTITAEGYEVKVNDVLLHVFKHRIAMEKVTAVLINGGVSMRSFKAIKQSLLEELEKAETKVPQFVQPISGTLETGKSLYFQGIITEDTDRFSIDLPCGEDKDSDIALRFNVQLTLSVVVLNTFLKGAWGAEEKVTKMPFRVGESFELVFLITSDGFQVLVNGEKFYLYKYRIAVERVGTVLIDGPVSIQSVTTMEASAQTDVIFEIAPFVQPIPSLKAGTSMYFPGSVPDGIDSFSIFLQCGEKEGCNVALSISAQFKPSQQLEFNSFEKGKWGTPEKAAKMPFIEGRGFEMVLLVTAVGYQVTVNEQQVHLFKHHIPAERVNAIQILGGVLMEPITIIEQHVVDVPGGGGVQVCPAGQVLEQQAVVPSCVQPLCSLDPGKALYFQGSVPDEAARFSIDLLCGEAEGSDVVLGLSAQFKPTESLVLNSRDKGKWGKEEKVAGMHLQRGKSFELVFNVTSKGFQVKVGGKDLHMFKHRLDMGRVSAVRITGDVLMESLNIMEMLGQAAQEGLEFQGQVEVISGEPIFNPPLPYTGEIAGGLTVNKSIVITGTVAPGAKSFSCTFLSGSGDIGLVLIAQVGEGVVVRNSCLAKKWGAEETETQFNPFQEGKQFEMVIRCQDRQFEVFVNGQLLFDFAHRLKPFTQIQKLEVTGDVQVSYILL